ncbi:glutamate--tRNA ligase family protein [Pontibacter rugosus]|uniref:Glutamate--tRNA ligase family protein n=2 Tax=Pontibacter rugosus TaxID=1745966 RepID=A0ABW3SWV5_9BACT
MPLRTRLAPTPSGYLHLGNVLSFAITWALARQQQGTVILRIDDLDNARFRPEYLQDIFDTLHFAGLDYDEGPANAADFLANYSQHLRLPQYRATLQELVNQGLVYACPCSRKQLATYHISSNHACKHTRHPLTLPDTAWRVHIPEHVEIKFEDLLLQTCTIPIAAAIPDFVVQRKEGIPAYQVASLTDDLEMEVNLIVRGEDLITSTAAQLYLAQQLSNRDFVTTAFVHHPVVLEPNGHKLSKSHASLSIKEMRQNNLSSKGLWSILASIVGLDNREIEDASGFLDNFSLETLQKINRDSLQTI